MKLAEFCARHEAALNLDEIRHGIVLSTLGGAKDSQTPLKLWSLGEGQACALQAPGRGIALGDMTHDIAFAFGRDCVTSGEAFSGVVGPADSTGHFVEGARSAGAVFGEVMPQDILALALPVQNNRLKGHYRIAEVRDADLHHEWMSAFCREATPHAALLQRAASESILSQGRHHLWLQGDEPVAIASIVRRTARTGAIAAVYTPPPRRNRGYAGCVVTSLCQRLFHEGKDYACLYVDKRNPASNRCYAKIGFTAHCETAFYPRLA